MEMTLAAGNVDTWYTDLTTIDVRPDLLQRTLSMEERERAGRFRFDRDRQNYERRTYLLRLLLADYLGSEPAEVRFRLSRYGKPQCENFARIRFNLSHSHGRALYACRLDREVGVDLECMRPRGFAEIVRSIFSPGEQRRIAALPEQERLAAFYRCWTLKEAYVKARGEGLSIPLDSFEVTVADSREMHLVSCSLSSGDTERWKLFSLPLFPGYLGAIVAEVPCFAPQVRRLTACEGRLLAL